MSEYNAKNYTEQGGEKTVIGGTLEIKEGASVTGLPFELRPADATALGGVKAVPATEEDVIPVRITESGFLVVPANIHMPGMGNQPDSTASTIAGLVTDFNALLSKLKSAGFMEKNNPA